MPEPNAPPRLPAPALPPRLVARARRARVALEVGAGQRFDTALALHAADPDARWIVSDVDERVLLAPQPLEALIVDVLRPDLDALRGVDLVYAVRLPEELQAAALRLARALGADFALRPLKDEWADLGPARVEHWGDGWRYVPFEASNIRRE